MERSSRQARWLLFAAAALAAGLIAVSACGGGGGKEGVKLYSPQDNRLDVYDLETGAGTVLIPAERNTVNGQACLVPGGDGQFLLGEDTNQGAGERQGWMIFTADGRAVRKLEEPRADNEPRQIEPFGCAFDAEQRLFTSDVGEGSFDGRNGKLILYFPPDYSTSCILSHNLRVAGAIAIDDDGSVLVPESVPPGDVLRFSKPYPRDASECDGVPPTESVFIQDESMGTPAGIARAPNGHWYVSSVFVPPLINEYDEEGAFVRTIASGDGIGNPQGIAVGPDGTVYYADLGLVVEPGKLPGPGDGTGSVRKVTFDEDGNPQPPVIIASGLNFPDAVSVFPPP